jgi:hypothetical protein
MSDDLVKRLRAKHNDTCPLKIRHGDLINEDGPEAADRIEKLETALRKVLIGGNHVALLIGVGHPLHTVTHEKALAHYGAGDAYEAWCCWKTIMEARKALEGKDD